MASNTVSIRVVGDSKDLQRAFRDAEASSKSFGDRFKNDAQMLGRWAATGAKAVGALATVVVGISVKGGIDRLMGLERANKQLSQLGVETKAADGLMDSLLDTLRGTPFALDKGAASLAGFVASGRDLDDIPRLIQQVTDAAAFGNTTLEEVDFLWQRIQTTGRVTNEELRMLAERNIPVYTQLAAAFGTTADEVFDMASNGELSADMFFDAWEQAAEGTIDGTVRISGAAKAMGETTEGAWGNMRTAMSRFGATLLEDVFPLAKDVFNAIGEGFDRMGQVMSEAFGGVDTSGFEDFIERIPGMMEDAAEGVVTLWRETEVLRDVLGTLVSGGIELVSNRLVQLGIVAGGVYKLLTLSAAHPLLAGLALLALAIGATETRMQEAEAAGKDLASRWEEMTVLARELALVELFSPSQVALLEEAGVTLRDLATGETSWAEAKARVNDEITNFLGLSSPYDTAGRGALETLEGLAAGEDAHREEIERKKEATNNWIEAQRIANAEAEGGIGVTEDATGATEDLTEAIEGATEAEYDHAAAINAVIEANNRAYSPILRAIGAAEDAKTAQEEYNAALDEFGPGSDEAVEAAGNLIEANGNLDAALAQIVEEAGPNWRAEFRRVAEQAGIAEEDIDEMIAKVEEADGMTATVTVETETGKAQDALDRWLRNNSGRSIGVRVNPTGSIANRFHEGVHRVPGHRGQEVPAILEAGEQVISASEVERMERAGRNGGGTVFNIVVHAGLGTNGHDVGEQIIEEIEKARRRGIAV